MWHRLVGDFNLSTHVSCLTGSRFVQQDLIVSRQCLQTSHCIATVFDSSCGSKTITKTFNLQWYVNSAFFQPQPHNSRCGGEEKTWRLEGLPLQHPLALTSPQSHPQLPRVSSAWYYSVHHACQCNRCASRPGPLSACTRYLQNNCTQIAIQSFVFYATYLSSFCSAPSPRRVASHSEIYLWWCLRSSTSDLLLGAKRAVHQPLGEVVVVSAVWSSIVTPNRHHLSDFNLVTIQIIH